MASPAATKTKDQGLISSRATNRYQPPFLASFIPSPLREAIRLPVMLCRLFLPPTTSGPFSDCELSCLLPFSPALPVSPSLWQACDPV